MIVLSLYLSIQLNDKKYKTKIIKNTDSLNTALIRKVKIEEKKKIEEEEIAAENNEEKKSENKLEVKETPQEVKNEIKQSKSEEKIIEEKVVETSIVVEEKQEEIKTGNIDSVYVGLRFNGSMSAYGRDCCGSNPGMTSSGFDLKTSLYYYDSTYGNLRVLASDKNFKLYSVIKVSDPRDGTYNAIVLDRAGSIIGLNKTKKFDLAVESESFASNTYGIHSNVTFEVLRVGR